MKYQLAILALVTACCLPERPSAQVIDLGNTTTRAVVIGISDYHPDSYRDAIPDLRFADRDGEALRSLAGELMKRYLREYGKD